MARAFTSLLLALPLAFVVGCADCGGGTPDGGTDGGGTDTDAGPDDQCRFIGSDCEDSEDCCGDLVCGDNGICGAAPTCVDNDSFAGTPASPADLDELGDNTPLACSGFNFLDVFSIEAEAGEILRITMQTEGLAPDTAVAQGQADIDMYLLNGPPTGVSSPNGGNQVDGPIVAAGATESSTEQILYVVPESGTYYLAFTVWSGPDAAYSVQFSRGVSCNLDADCGVDFDYCRVAVDPDFLQVVQECAVWTAPGCGNGAEEGGGDVHSDSNAVSLTDSATGLTCNGDIDVFSFDKPLTAQALITVSSADLPADELLVASVVMPDGTYDELFVVGEIDTPVEYAIPVGATPGTWYLYIQQFGVSTEEATYEVSVDIQAGCRTDADCAGGRTCGTEIYGGGPQQVCVNAVDPCSDNDSDNSRSAATPLVEGVQASAGVCMGGFDLYAIELDRLSDVTLNLTWTGTSDLDLYVFAEDGTPLGAGWYGNSKEEWTARALAPQTLYAWVDVFACGFESDGTPIQCDDLKSYNLSVTIADGTPCGADADCAAGGTNADDPSQVLACQTVTVAVGGGADGDGGVSDGDAGDTDGGTDDGGTAGEVDAGTTDVEVQACVRPTPAMLFTQQGGETCFDNTDCVTLFCIDDYCTSDCGANADCDATLGAGNGYCFELVQEPFCLLNCASAADCERVFGPLDDGAWVCTSGQCDIQ